MKQIIKSNIPVVLAIFLAFGMAACKKDAYLTDGGLSKVKTSYSTYDYLKNNQYHQFDTVMTLIDHYQLKNTVNNAKTFFAFTDMSVNLLMKSLKVTTIDQLTDSVSAKLFTQYMFNKTITLDDATLTAVPYTNEVGSAAPSAIKKVSTGVPVYLANSAPVFNYFTLEYVKINGAVDGSAGTPANDLIDLVLQCQTTGIQTSTGTTLHVLVNNAALNKL
ncbi:hypothetical protein [Mucilaginibacter phyllosphaerae]|uniref:FAS1 domain-containing protein n=1 Tax=Mucilaginibacter phyllosphaerae TaxID=1812349 RepID=A0A4Y8ACP9_9SPHI|nr:hypothetical protein [Mucilaginibacter phyllosphaerae]MBB3969507.1 hypothetical protein [Mucilaginibacter phyllosphaerae]TEW65718.1 hypothetical protein E2R65_11265 [Mucilaginibacter phyllosphaerae]GGH09035.1 hypothetical protein GCM10007352_14350 [Mucilaginibacter phyllosphaerae]